MEKVSPANRDFIEGLSFIDEAQKNNVGILVYGSPLQQRHIYNN
jgi:diphthamide biosynthesis methyltransferase